MPNTPIARNTISDKHFDGENSESRRSPLGEDGWPAESFVRPGDPKFVYLKKYLEVRVPEYMIQFPKTAKEKGKVGFGAQILLRYNQKALWREYEGNFDEFVMEDLTRHESALISAPDENGNETNETKVLIAHGLELLENFPFLDGKKGRPTIERVVAAALSRYGYDNYLRDENDFIDYLSEGLVEMREGLNC